MERRAEDMGDDAPELLPGYPILIVDNRMQLHELVDKLKGEEFIGIDSEWKAQYLAPNESVALLQIAIPEAVYLVDFCALEAKMNETDWDIFLRSLLCSPARKIGFDFANDLRAIFAGAPSTNIRSVADHICNVVCLKRLVENLLKTDSRFMDDRMENASLVDGVGTTNDNSDDNGSMLHFKLSDLSDRLLNIKLDKSEQCSNWSIRPLRASQKRYAAMDAYIVIELYGKLREMAESRGIDFESLVELSMVNGKKKDKVKTKKERVKMDDMTWAEICKKLEDVQSGQRPATQLRCIVDSMLLGLGKHLRRCGVNVLIPSDRNDLKIKAEGNSRIIVTSGKAYNELRRLFADRVLAIPNASAMGPIDQLKYVFSKHSISFEGLDVFSRCLECNGMYFVKVPGPVIQALYENNVTCKNSFHDEPFDFNGWLERLRTLDCRDFSGIGCCLLPPVEGHMVVQCYGGIVYITANIVKHNDLEEGVDVLVRKVPEQVSSRPGYVFFICGLCGKVYWEEH